MKKSILVIDDERSVRDAFVLALADSDYDVRTAQSGLEALETVSASCPDLIFLDLRMPGIDGVETLRRLQTFCAGVPVFIVTAFRGDYMDALSRTAQEGLRFQVAEKPLDSGQIVTIAQSVLEDESFA